MYKNFKANKNYITWNSFDFLCRVVPYVTGRWDISDTLLLSWVFLNDNGVSKVTYHTAWNIYFLVHLSLISSTLATLGLSNSPLNVSMPTFHVQSLPSLDLFLDLGNFSYEYELFIFQKTKIFTYSLVKWSIPVTKSTSQGGVYQSIYGIKCVRYQTLNSGTMS